jgi:hypothetical protein
LFAELLRHPGTNRVVAASQEPGVVSVQALDPGMCPTDATVWTWTGVVDRQFGVALCGVSGVRIGDQRRINLRLCTAHRTARLQAAHRQDLAFSDEPESRWHRFSVVQQWSIAQHYRGTRFVSHDDLECPARCPTDQLTNGSDIVAHVVSDG